MAKTKAEKAAEREALKQELKVELEAEAKAEADAEKNAVDDEAKKKADAEAAEKQAATDAQKVKDDKVTADKAAADAADKASRATRLDPYRDTLTKLVQTKRITPAMRTEIETDLQGDDAAAIVKRHLSSLEALPEGGSPHTGPQTDQPSGISEAVDRLIAKPVL